MPGPLVESPDVRDQASREPSERAVFAGLLVLSILVVAAYYLASWRSVRAFVLDIDHCDLLFCDFHRVFYSMGKKILSLKKPLGGYYYSAFAALLLIPFGALSRNAGSLAWGIAQVVTTAAFFMLPLRRLLRLRPGAAIGWTLLFLTSFPLLHNFKWGQFGVILMLCALAAYHLHEEGHPIWAGILLGFAAAIKYYAALLLLPFLLRGKWRVAIAFAAAVTMFLVVIPWAAIGPAGWLDFQRRSLDSVEHARGWIMSDPNSHYFAHVAERFLGVAKSSAWRHVLEGIGLAIAGGNAFLIWTMRRSSSGRDVALSIAGGFLMLPFVVGTSWPHYFAFLPFCQMAIAREVGAIEGRRVRAVAAASIGASIALSSVFAFRAMGGSVGYGKAGALLISACLAVAALHIAVRTARCAIDSERTRST